MGFLFYYIYAYFIFEPFINIVHILIIVYREKQLETPIACGISAVTSFHW